MDDIAELCAKLDAALAVDEPAVQTRLYELERLDTAISNAKLSVYDLYIYQQLFVAQHRENDPDEKLVVLQKFFDHIGVQISLQSQPADEVKQVLKASVASKRRQ